MNSVEQKHRKRALIAWTLVFSLLFCAFWFGRTETQAATAVDGVSLTVEYNTGGTTAAATQTYYRYYVDEAAGTMDTDVTITMPSESEISLADGQLLTAWQMTDASQNEITILPGESVTFAWDDLIGETSAVTMYIYGMVREYSVAEYFTGEDYNTYSITNYDSIGDISINRLADGFTVTAPGTPVLESHVFDQWQLLNSDYMVIGYATAGGAFQSPDGGDLLLEYWSYDRLTIEAIGIPMATIHFYKNMDDTSNALDTVTVTKQTDDNGTKALSVTMPSAPAGDDGSVFLAWNELIGYSYKLPGTTVTYNDDDGDGYAAWPALSSGYVASAYGAWLDVSCSYGDEVTVDQEAGTASVSRYNDYFTLTAPSAPMAAGYLFTGWTIVLDDVTYSVAAGATVSDDSGSPVELAYENYADMSVTFTAQWEEVATIYYHQNMEEYKTGWAMHSVQVKPEYDASGNVMAGVYTTYGSVSLTDGGLLLGWTNVADGTFIAPEVETTFEWDQLDDKNSIHLVAIWLYTDWVLGDVAEDWQEKVTIVHETDGMYSLTLPESEPVMTGYSFDGWEHTQGQQTYSFAAGENTSAQGLSYAYPSTTEVTHEFVAQWTADPTPTPTNTPTPTPTNTPTPTPTNTPTPTPTNTPVPTPTNTPVPTPTNTPVPTPTNTPTPRPTPTNTPTPRPTNTPVPTPTNTPTPTPTNTPTPTPAPVVVSVGEMELSVGQKYQFPEGKWTIEGDSTVYEGGMVFYVPVTGMYRIKEGE